MNISININNSYFCLFNEKCDESKILGHFLISLNNNEHHYFKITFHRNSNHYHIHEFIHDGILYVKYKRHRSDIIVHYKIPISKDDVIIIDNIINNGIILSNNETKYINHNYVMIMSKIINYFLHKIILTHNHPFIINMNLWLHDFCCLFKDTYGYVHNFSLNEPINSIDNFYQLLMKRITFINTTPVCHKYINSLPKI